MHPNYTNKPAFFMNRTGNTGFGASVPSFGQSTANPFMFSSAFQTPSTSSAQTSFGANLLRTTGLNKTSFGFGSTPSSTAVFGQQQSGASLSQSNADVNGTPFKFVPVINTDTLYKGEVIRSIHAKQHCITCMKEYEGKSLEELRFEDYSCNRKGLQQHSSFGTTTSLLGEDFGKLQTFIQTSTSPPSNSNQTNTSSFFGKPFIFSATTNAVPSISKSSSANEAPKPQFQPSAGMFGQNMSSNAGGFGQNATPNLFKTPTSFTTGFCLGQASSTQPSSLLQMSKPGTVQPITTSGLCQPNYAANFGKPLQPRFPQTSQPQQTFAFNSATINLPSPSTVPGNSSSNEAAKPLLQPSFTGMFGQNGAKNPFETPTSFTTGFNSAQASPSSLLQVSKPCTVQPTTTSGLCQTNQPSYAPNFGKSLQPSFPQTSQPQQTFAFNNATINPPSSNTVPGSTCHQSVQFPPEPLEDPKKTLLLASDIFPVYLDLQAVFGVDTISTTNPQEIEDLLENSKNPGKPKIKLDLPKPKRRSPKAKRGNNPSEDFFYSIKDFRSCAKMLKIRDKENKVDPNCVNELIQEAEECLKREIEDEDGSGSFHTPAGSDTDSPERFDDLQLNPLIDDSANSHPVLTSVKTNLQENKTYYNPVIDLIEEAKKSLNRENEDQDSSGPFHAPVGSNTDSPERFHNLQLGSPIDVSSNSHPVLTSVETNLQEHFLEIENDTPYGSARENPAGVVLTRPGYYIIPDLQELHLSMNENGECMVQGFTIGRRGYGNVHFPDIMNIAHLNLDEIVQFQHREVVVYPDDSKKPPVGEGLNRRAQITLDQIYPREKDTRKYITDVNRIIKSDFTNKLIRVSHKHNTSFVDYRPETGSWVFNVEHFSEYKFSENDDEGCDLERNTDADLR